MQAPYLDQITLYPIKSLAGISVNQWPVTPRGLQYDRQWMLVDQKGRFLSQRQLPQMSLIETAITEHQLILSANGVENLTLALAPKKEEE
ncbi:MAG: MOSC domain-containing protein, partial [Methylococcales bacterium]|nr:MOSC domain-containing protein [Methylococcales bacterium]